MADFDWRVDTLRKGTCSRVGQWVRGDCPCGETDVLLYDAPDDGALVCNACVRLRPVDTRQACDKCGAKGNVWRDPIPRRNEYLCMGCHDPEALFINRWANKVRESAALGYSRASEVRAGCVGCGLRRRGAVRFEHEATGMQQAPRTSQRERGEQLMRWRWGTVLGLLAFAGMWYLAAVDAELRWIVAVGVTAAILILAETLRD